ncbi:MAG: hypothetical protein JW892_17565 [Anaerolineae bacterium]|nr:hypothetical protein [Anaerolineae bacterium]
MNGKTEAQVRAERTVGDARRVERQMLDIQTMLDNGLLISISFFGGSVLTRKLDWEELGISSARESDERIRAGQKLMAPPQWVKRLASLEVRFRQAADKYTTTLEVFRPWVWLPLDSYDDFKARWAALEAELETFKSDLLADWTYIKDENATWFADLGRRAWRSMQARYDGKAVVVVKGASFDPNDPAHDAEAEFVDWVVNNGLAQMPTERDIKGIQADYRTSVLFTAADVLKHAAVNAEAQAEVAEQQLRSTQAWAAKREVEVQVWKSETLAQAEVSEAKARADARRKAILEEEQRRARVELANTVSPVTEALGQIIGTLGASVVEVAESIRKNGHVRGKVAEKARNLVSIYKAMGGDVVATSPNIREALLTLSASLVETGEGETKYDADRVLAELGNVEEILQQQAAEVEAEVARQTRASAIEF